MSRDLTDQRPLRAALIVDGKTLPCWAAEAVNLAVSAGTIEVVIVFCCRNNRVRRRVFQNFGYYALRSLFIRPAVWNAIPLSQVIGQQINTIEFDADVDGAWQRTPESIHLIAAKMNIDVVVKFGMGLMRDPQLFPSKFGVLSYHHGDPMHYRGRPAGFYEVYNDAPHVGAVVQRLTNRLDGGQFLAAGLFRLERHSYSKTLDSLYSGSVCLLGKALEVCTQPLKDEGAGAVLGLNYRLPGNALVAKFLFKLLFRKLSRIGYGAFWRKDWHLFELDLSEFSGFHGKKILYGSPLPKDKESDFEADPFYLDEHGETLVCERVRKSHIHGEIVSFDESRKIAGVMLSENGKHFSYPHVVRVGNRTFILPEIASWSGPILFEVDQQTGKLFQRIVLQGLESEHLLDPTLLYSQGTYWLFGTPDDQYRKMDTLKLWYSKNLEGPYEPHQLSPIVLDPACARPAGGFLFKDGQLLRFGQDNTRAYGAGLSVMKVEELAVNTYKESLVGQLRWHGYGGPHTINFCSKNAILDGYRDKFDYTAWLTRIKNRF